MSNSTSVTPTSTDVRGARIPYQWVYVECCIEADATVRTNVTTIYQ